MKSNETIHFDTPPILLAAWPGLGNVGILAIDYLRRKMETKVFAQVDMSTLVAPSSMVVKEGIVSFPELPDGIFHYHKDPDLIFFESSAQVAGKEGVMMAETILDFARRFRVPRVYTAAALTQPMSHTMQSNVLCASNSSRLLRALETYGTIPMSDGQIAGLNGLLLGVAASRGIDAACILGTIPTYAGNVTYPKAAREIVKTISSVLDVDVDLEEIDEATETMDTLLEGIEERIREYFPSVISQGEPGEEFGEMESEQVPQYVMDKIEVLFHEAERDREQAMPLKEELDRWNLFDLYEDRFLDLFEE
jgi:hypothetical protein